MKWNTRLLLVGALALFGLAPVSLILAQEKADVAVGGTVNVTLSTAATPPPVSITLLERHSHTTPHKGGHTHTGGGLIDVVSPTPDTAIFTMSGVVVSNAGMTFDLEQCFEVSFDDPKVKKAKMSLEGRVLGLLRGGRMGCASYSDACADIHAGPAHIVSIAVQPHSVCGCDNLVINDHDGPKSIPVTPGKYTLHQTFGIDAHNRCVLFKGPSAEFAADPALDALWISYFEPFHGVAKKDFGFQVVLKVAADDEPKKEPEKLGAPTPNP